MNMRLFFTLLTVSSLFVYEVGIAYAHVEGDAGIEFCRFKGRNIDLTLRDIKPKHIWASLNPEKGIFNANFEGSQKIKNQNVSFLINYTVSVSPSKETLKTSNIRFVLELGDSETGHAIIALNKDEDGNPINTIVKDISHGPVHGSVDFNTIASIRQTVLISREDALLDTIKGRPLDELVSKGDLVNAVENGRLRYECKIRNLYRKLTP